MEKASGSGQPHRVRARARLRTKAQLTLPEEIRRALRVQEGDELEFAVQEDGSVTVRGFVSVPTDQVWRYRSAQEAGQGAIHGSADATFAYLDTMGSVDTD